ncbi:MAG: aspartate-semialdehyde dehydrogenase [Myxococcota bacterium]
MTKQLKVAVVGTTGLVGQQMLRVLERRRFPVHEFVPVASPRSAGKKVTFAGREHEVRAIAPEVFEGVDVALFSAGGGTSREWAPVAASKGALVIDNSSTWRMDPEVPLVVPEVNLDHAANRPKGIIANPNCSTIQMVVALQPLHAESRIRRVVVSTYQAISGAGARAARAFDVQARAFGLHEAIDSGALGGQLAGSLLMTWKPDTASGYQEEELKMVHETKKILADPDMRVSPTAVRVPVLTGHSESITVECEAPISAARASELLENAPGIEVLDDLAAGKYPTPHEAAGTDPVYVGRIRADIGNPGGLQLWVVADNILKGAALNAVQIAEGVLGT